MFEGRAPERTRSTGHRLGIAGVPPRAAGVRAAPGRGSVGGPVGGRSGGPSPTGRVLLDTARSGAEHPGVAERPPSDMTRPPPGSPLSTEGVPSRGGPGLSPAIEAALRGMGAPPVPAGLRDRVLAAAASPARVVPFGAFARERGRLLAMVGAAAAAAAIVFVVGGQLRAASRDRAAPWETLHPEAKAPAPRVRVVNDPARPDWTSASIVNASFDPLEGP